VFFVMSALVDFPAELLVGPLQPVSTHISLAQALITRALPIPGKKSERGRVLVLVDAARLRPLPGIAWCKAPHEALSSQHGQRREAIKGGKSSESDGP
jgi:hypothetical protein